MRLLPLLLLILSTLLLTLASTARAALPTQAEPLIVGVAHAPPFAIRDDQQPQGWDGLAVNLWRDAAEALDLAYEWREVEREALVSGVANGSLDVAVGAVASAEAVGQVDFTQPYLVSTLGTAQPAERSLLAIAGAFFSPRFWQIAAVLSIAFLLVGIVVWLFEREANTDMFQEEPARGIWSGFWWAGVTMSTIGYGDKAPLTVGGRIVALIWMLIAMAVTAILTASLVSVLTLDAGLGTGQFPGSLRGRSVGSVAQTAAADFLTEERIAFQGYDSVVAGLRAVRDGDADVFVHDAATLRHVNGESLGGALRVTATDINPQRYVFVLPPGSELRDPLNRIVLEATESPAWQALVRRYVPEGN